MTRRNAHLSPPGIAVLVDYDGTVVTRDVSDELVRRFAPPHEWRSLDSAYRRGEIGSRTLLAEEARFLPVDPAEFDDLVSRQPLDPAFRQFVSFAKVVGVVVEVVSDGLGFFVARGLAEAGLSDLPVYSAEMLFESGGPVIRFPNGHPTCTVCGTCKRDRILAHQATGTHVVYVGDGHSDQYAAAYADTLFAKNDLADLCDNRDIAYRPWTTFSDVQDWLDDAIRRGDVLRSAIRPFICGPEAEA